MKGGKTVPAEIPWFLHRVATSDAYSSGLHEIMWGWTLDMVLDAHMVLDLRAVVDSTP